VLLLAASCLLQQVAVLWWEERLVVQWVHAQASLTIQTCSWMRYRIVLCEFRSLPCYLNMCTHDYGMRG
jgi:hypothetical protein